MPFHRKHYVLIKEKKDKKTAFLLSANASRILLGRAKPPILHPAREGEARGVAPICTLHPVSCIMYGNEKK